MKKTRYLIKTTFCDISLLSEGQKPYPIRCDMIPFEEGFHPDAKLDKSDVSDYPGYFDMQKYHKRVQALRGYLFG